MLPRITVSVIGALAAAVLMHASPASAADSGPKCPQGNYQLTIVSWGGAYENSQKKAYYEPYMKACPNVTIVQTSASNEAVAKMRAQAEAGNVTWDIVDAVISDAIRACDEGLAMEIDINKWAKPAPDGTPAKQDFGKTLQSPCFIPEIVYSTLIGYRTDVKDWHGKTPKSICSLFDTKDFPGKRSLEKRPINNLEWALACAGVPRDKIYDVLGTDAGLAKAFKELDKIKKDTIWWSAGAETPQRLADGEVVMGSTYNGRIFNAAVVDKQPIATLWDMEMMDLDGWIIPQGVKKKDLPAIKSFIRFATDTQRLADQAQYISYGPARASSQPLVGYSKVFKIDMKPWMPTNPENAKTAFHYDYKWWADHRDDLDAKFQAWLIQ